MKTSTSRRQLLKSCVMGATAGLVANRAARSAAPQKLDPAEPAARALGYVEDAAQVDPAKNASFVKGSNCENCLQLQGTAGSRYRPCSAFGGKLVSIAGWCASWTAEM